MVKDRYWQAKKVTLIGALVNALLGFIKLFGGILCYSHALAADGIHSFSDLITDIMVLLASKYGGQSADKTHPYGHERFETAATLLLALLLILAGFGIVWDAIHELINRSYHAPVSWWALAIAILSMIANEILFYYTQYVGKQIQSSLILANAWHHRSDAAASVVVALGLLGSLLGIVYFDVIAAIIVGIIIIKMGLNCGWDSVKELVDTAVEQEILDKIEQIIQQFEGVKKVHQLRTRLMGGDILIDAHILVSPQISVSEGHFIAQQVHHVLINQLERIKDVIVHVDPEDDEDKCPSLDLPNRKVLEQTLLIPWKQQFSEIRYWILHYLEGSIRIDLIYHNSISAELMEQRMKQLSACIMADLLNFQFISKVRLLNEYQVIDNMSHANAIYIT